MSMLQKLTKKLIWVSLLVTASLLVIKYLIRPFSGIHSEVPNSDPWYVVNGTFCTQLITSDPSKAEDVEFRERIIRDTASSDWEQKFSRPSHLYRESSESCAAFLQRKHFLNDTGSPEEKEFPLAYAISVGADTSDYIELESLLRAIYRPQHTICIQLMESTFTEHALRKLVECFPKDSLFISNRTMPPAFNASNYVALQSYLACMEDLWSLRHARQWRYLFTSRGVEMPLRTNHELVQILKVFNGSNHMLGSKSAVRQDRVPKTKLPFKFDWIKGSEHIVVTPAFVDFALHNEKAVKILRLLKAEGSVIEEMYFQTLYFNPSLGAPGSFIGEQESATPTHPYIGRLVDYQVDNCRSKHSEGYTCTFGIHDLPLLAKGKHLLIHNLERTFQTLAMRCVEEWYWSRTYNRTPSSIYKFDLDWYKRLIFVKNHM